MRVTLWIDPLEPEPGGIGRYTWELCKGLPAHGSVDAVSYFGRGRRIHDPELLLRGDSLPPQRRGLLGLGSWLDRRQLNSAVVHGPNFFLPPFARSGVITVHDLSVLRYPQTHPTERIQLYEREFARSLDLASFVITPTETIRDEVVKQLGIVAERVVAVPMGVDERFRPRGYAELDMALADLGLVAGQYGLCVSTLEPRKKIGELLDAWRLLPPDLRGRYPLVLAGGKGWLNEQLHQQIASAAAEGWLRHLGFVDERLLPALYAGAALFVYPSIYEGFGLPPLEAMASGVPVVVAGRSCLPEVCGEVALYVDPDDTQGFSQVLEQGLTDTQRRDLAIRSGLERSQLFSWERCIEGTVSVYLKSCS